MPLNSLEAPFMTTSARRLLLWILLVAAPCVIAVPAVAQDATDSEAILAAKDWVAPPGSIAEAVLAPRYLNATLTNISPDKAWFFHMIGEGPPTMERFSRPFDELGGQFYDRQANRHRNLTTRSSVGINIISAEDGSVIEVSIPEGAKASNATWSPDGSQLAFFVHTDDETHIYVADPTDGDSRQITRSPVLATLVQSFEWTADSQEIATVLIPDNRAVRPEERRVPTGPQVKQTEEGENVLRTYASLMETPYHEELLEWHVTGQLASISVDDRRVTRVGSPSMIRSFDFSPTGEFSRVTLMQRPFSYVVPVTSFGRTEQIWDRTGSMLAEIDVTELNTGLRGAPSAPGVGGDEEEPDRRQLAWREDGAGLTFLQQEAAEEDEDEAEEDSGRGGRAGGARQPDRVMLWSAPFGEDNVTVVYESSQRLASHRFSLDHNMLFLSRRPQGGGFGSSAARGTVTEFAVDLSDPETAYTIAEYEADDFYANAGTLLLAGGQVAGGGRGRGGSAGGQIVQTSADGASVFLSGTQYNEDPMAGSPMNFLDRVDIRTGETERLYESSNDGQYERIVSVVDVDAEDFIVSRETTTDVPQSYRFSNGQRTQLTQNIDYTPDITNAPRQRFTVERPDGFRFLVNVQLPPGWDGEERLPAMFWFYPREFTDQESYDDRGRTYNKNAFENYGTRSMQYLVRLGYAVVTPDAPIVGKQGAMNNNYEHDLRNNLAAVIDELDERGIIDRRRLGLGGHSYGAFGTVNAMVHTPFFKAGIAGDGNYNRTLTPLSFQSERRFLWDAKDVYLGMSPFLYANNLTGALLMYHGLQDQNVGTDPIHSPKLFHALNGLNKPAAMYLYPFEDHGPATEETLLDLWARWTAWLDIHLEPQRKPITQ